MALVNCSHVVMLTAQVIIVVTTFSLTSVSPAFMPHRSVLTGLLHVRIEKEGTYLKPGNKLGWQVRAEVARARLKVLGGTHRREYYMLPCL